MEKDLRFVLLVVLGVFTFCSAEAQIDQLKGRIVEIETNQSIPFSTISIPKLKIGTSADENGQFVLDLTGVKPKEVILVSSLGYEPLRVAIQDLADTTFHIFKLNQSIQVMEEIIVRGEALNARELIEKAAKSKKKTISSDAYFISGVYDEEVKVNNKPVGVMQGYGLVYMDGFNNRKFRQKEHPRDQIQWKHIRRSAYQTDELDHTSYIAAYKLLKAKDLHLYAGPVSLNKMGSYTYQLDSISSLDNVPVYIISFHTDAKGSDKKKKFGTVSIEGKYFSILNLEVTQTLETRNFDFYDKNLTPRSSLFSINFSKTGKTSFVNRISLTLNSTKSVNGTQYEVSEELSFFTGQYNKTNKTVALNQGQMKVLFYEMVNPIMIYDQNYWRNYKPLIVGSRTADSLAKEFETNNGKRVVPLPKGFNTYQDMYNDQKLMDLYFSDF